MADEGKYLVNLIKVSWKYSKSIKVLEKQSAKFWEESQVSPESAPESSGFIIAGWTHSRWWQKLWAGSALLRYSLLCTAADRGGSLVQRTSWKWSTWSNASPLPLSRNPHRCSALPQSDWRRRSNLAGTRRKPGGWGSVWKDWPSSSCEDRIINKQKKTSEWLFKLQLNKCKFPPKVE